jgi:hypothetical protein
MLPLCFGLNELYTICDDHTGSEERLYTGYTKFAIASYTVLEFVSLFNIVCSES